MYTKQLTFQKPTKAAKRWPNGHLEPVIFGYYESILIIKENGWLVGRTINLNIPTYPVLEVECPDGTKFIFDVENSPYLINQAGRPLTS